MYILFMIFHVHVKLSPNSFTFTIHNLKISSNNAFSNGQDI